MGQVRAVPGLTKTTFSLVKVLKAIKHNRFYIWRLVTELIPQLDLF